MPQIQAAIERLLIEQRQHWPCWLAIGLAVGILVYFALPIEPPLWSVTAVLGGCVVLAVLAFIVPKARRLLWLPVLLFTVGLGFAAASLRTSHMHPHFLEEALHAAAVTGRVTQIEPLPTGVRLTLEPAYLGRNVTLAEATALKLQITVLTGTDDIEPGTWVRLRADLHPPSGPAAPGAFDFRRQAFFAGVDGVGFSYTVRTASPPNGVVAAVPARWLGDGADRLRQQIAQRIADILPDESGALAIALVVGNQTALRRADMAAMRDSGLSHLLSISGLHISLAAGIMFFSCRLIFALFPWLALRIATKKWAAVLALLGAAFYAILAGAAEPSLSGSVVPTQRSLLMVLIAFSAILLDRSPISLRLVAWSAVVLLLWQPDSLIGPSFQMSFAAVFALIASFEALRPALARLRQYLAVPPVDMMGQVMSYSGYGLFWLFSLALSSLIASLATAPFGLYHFDRLQVYGIAANMLAVPLTGFWLMPAAVLALLLMPLGLDAPFWHLLGWGCEAILWIGRAVQHWPNAVIPVSAMPAWGLMAASAGLIWICLGRGWSRAIGLLGVVAMLVSIATIRQPDILLSESGRLIAAQSPAGSLVVSSNRIEKRVRETWLHRRAQMKSDSFEATADQASWFTCLYADACEIEVKGRHIIFDLGRVPSTISCATADIIIVPQRRIYCDGTRAQAKPWIIDQRDMARTGAIGLYLDKNEMTLETIAESIGARPWSAFMRATVSTDNDDGSDEAAPEAAQ